MSKTDKTRPYWVQLRDPTLPYQRTEWHRHFGSHFEEHGCDLSWPLPRTRRSGQRGCEVWSRYRDNEKLWGRSGWRRSYPNKHGSARMALRRLQADWRKTAAADRDTIDSTLDAPTNRWVWRRWYWD